MRRHAILTVLWVITDILLFIGCYVLAYFLRVGWVFSSVFRFDRFLEIALIVAPLWMIVLVSTRTFGLTRRQWSLRNAAYMAYSALVGLSLFSLLYYFRYQAFFSRRLLVEAYVIHVFVTFLWHLAFDRIRRSLLRRSPPAFPTLVIGTTRESAALVDLLLKRSNPLTPVAFLDPRGSKESSIHGIPVPGKLDRLERTLTELHITHVLQATALEQSINILSACRSHGITYLLLPSILGIVERDETVDSLEGCAVTVVRPAGKGWGWFFR